MTWEPCTTAPEAGDVIRWQEPIWAEPTQKRGKRDEIGEQMVTAKVVEAGETYVLQVEGVEILSFTTETEPPRKIKSGDTIKRKQTSLERGECAKRV